MKAIFPEEACSACEFQNVCPAKHIKDGNYRLEYKLEAMATSKRKQAQEDKDFKERYKIRSGIEATISEADRVTGLKNVWCRGLDRVRTAVTYKEAVKVHAVQEDPVAGIRYLSEKAHERTRFISPKELDLLLEACQVVKARFYLPALICLGAEHGASKQEALDLKWSDIDFDFQGGGLITFYRQKTGKHRTQFLMPRTREALLAWRKHQDWMRHRKKIKHVSSDFVFCRLDGTPIKRFDTAWRKVRKAAGLEDLHFHDQRHTYCSPAFFFQDPILRT